MDEETAKEILDELRLKIAIAQNKSLGRELEESYSGKWGIYMMFKNGMSSITPHEYGSFDKGIVAEAIERIRSGTHELKFPCGKKLDMKDIFLVMPMPVKG
ncbi:MAG: hypothetical protein ACUZ8H_05360 [Candidatus Anammoxibacter sp.]